MKCAERLTNLNARHHQGEVLGLGMLPADFQAMSHRRRQARLITVQTFGYAAFHLVVDHRHRIRFIYNRAQTRRGTLRNQGLLLRFPWVSQKGPRTLMTKAR